MIELRVESTLNATSEMVWRWVTDVRCLRAEMRPWLWMSVPRGLRNLADIDIHLGQPLFTSWLFGILPIGTSRLTLLELNPGQGFVEQSPMSGTHLWRHERQLIACNQGTRIIDTLTVKPVLATPVVSLFLRLFFNTRHRNLRRRQARQFC